METLNATLVGLQLRQSTAITAPPPLIPEDEAGSLPSPPQYDPNIMHRAVPPTLFSCLVLRDASVVDLAASFSLSVSFVAANWITSRSPLIGSEANSSGSPRQSCSSPSPADRVAYRNLADSLRSKLSAYSRDTTAAAESCAAALPYTLNTRCGFDARATHAQLKVRRGTVRKDAGGLYRTSHTLGGVCSGDSTYAEFVVESGLGGAGISVGVASRNVALHALVGSEVGSIGYHASGRVIIDGEWHPFGASYGPGDCVSVRVSRTRAVSSEVSSATGLSESASSRSSQHSPQGWSAAGNRPCWVVSFFLNGKLQGSRLLEMNSSEQCRMAVSLYSVESAVTVRCCVKEWDFFAAARNGDCRLRGICGVRQAGRVCSESAAAGMKGARTHGESPVSGGDEKTPHGY